MKRVITFIVVAAAVIVVAGCNSGQQSKNQPASDASTVSQKSSTSQNDGIKLVAQKTCPVMGSPINKALFADVNGKRVYVCCGMCINEIKGNPVKYLDKLKAMGEEPASI